MGRILVLDYGNANANSILRALQAIGAEALYSNDPTDLGAAQAIILPGVGHAGQAMAAIDRDGLRGPLEAARERGTRILGICLGMQLMSDWIEEGECAGLGWIGGRAMALSVSDKRRFKVPHIGWNTVDKATSLGLMRDRDVLEPYYFCHKYEMTDLPPTVATASFEYERERIAAFEHEKLAGVQFHPEKSHAAGRALFKTWLDGSR